MSGSDSKAYLQCIRDGCRATFDVRETCLTCSRCGDLLEVVYQWQFLEPEKLKELWRERKHSLWPADLSGVWRFRDLLWFAGNRESIVTLGEGNTPVCDAPRCAGYAGMKKLRLKHLGFNPTGSFKDYGMTAGVTRAKELGATAVACASTGNTSASMAAYAARAGMTALVLIPEGQIALGKLSQSLEYGAKTVQIEGDFDQAMRLVQDLSQVSSHDGLDSPLIAHRSSLITDSSLRTQHSALRTSFPLYLLNSINPFRIEGQKTIAFELLEQLDWQAPDRIVLPGGNLGNTSAIGKGLLELLALGLIDHLPKVTVIQAEGANPFFTLWHSAGRDQLEPVAHASTLATAIKIGNPVSWKKALAVLEATDGTCEQVSEEEIADAKAMIGRDGIGCEPASAASLAGIRKLVAKGKVDPEETVVAILTGNLLKDPGYTLEYHQGALSLNRDGQPHSLEGRFPNLPVRVKADASEILRILDTE